MKHKEKKQKKSKTGAQTKDLHDSQKTLTSRKTKCTENSEKSP
jgi:hypothetical protein